MSFTVRLQDYNSEVLMDEDLNELSREQLITEIKKLRNGIRQHRDSTGMNYIGTKYAYERFKSIPSG